MHIAITADLHWGARHADGDAATRALVADLAANPPDLLVLAGDVGAGDEFDECLGLFAGLPCAKALVPGNHDVWVTPGDPRGDSLEVYRTHLPAVAARYGFHYLDAGPLLLPAADLAVVGSMNWYDYTWADPALPAAFPDLPVRLRTKRFTRGQHNDANFVRWPHDDRSFTAECVKTLAAHLTEVTAGNVIVVTHHPPFRGLNYPRPSPPTPDGMLWEAFSGNVGVEALLTAHAERVRFAFCGHTHFAREGHFGPVRGYNVGGDYHFKRLLRLDWPAGTVAATEFAAG